MLGITYKSINIIHTLFVSDCVSISVVFLVALCQQPRAPRRKPARPWPIQQKSKDSRYSMIMIQQCLHTGQMQRPTRTRVGPGSKETTTVEGRQREGGRAVVTASSKRFCHKPKTHTTSSTITISPMPMDAKMLIATAVFQMLSHK